MTGQQSHKAASQTADSLIADKKTERQHFALKIFIESKTETCGVLWSEFLERVF